MTATNGEEHDHEAWRDPQTERLGRACGAASLLHRPGGMTRMEVSMLDRFVRRLIGSSCGSLGVCVCAAELEKSLERNMPNHLVVYEWEGQEDKIIAEAKAKGETAGRQAGRRGQESRAVLVQSGRQAGRALD